MIKAVIFDFGRVISAQKNLQLFHNYEVDLGLAPDTINTIMFDSPFWEQALLGKISISAFWQAVGPALNLHSEAAIESFQQRYYDDERINEDVVTLLHRLRHRYKLAILSNHPAGLLDWLVDWKIADLFETVVCSGDEGVAKPDSRAFEITLDRLGTKPFESVFIDDTPRHVEAARAMGLPALVFTDAESLREELADLSVVF